MRSLADSFPCSLSFFKRALPPLVYWFGHALEVLPMPFLWHLYFFRVLNSSDWNDIAKVLISIGVILNKCSIFVSITKLR